MFLHEGVGFSLEIPVHLDRFCVGFSHHVVDGTQHRVILDERPQEGIRRDDLVEHLDLFVFLEKLLPPLGIAEMLDELIHILVVEVVFDESKVAGNFGLHLVFEEDFQELEILDDGVDLVAVEGEGLLEFVEDAHEIQNEPMGLHHLLRLVLVGAVHPGDGLQQRVIAHRLVEIHGVKHGRVEAGEQFLGDDEDLRHLVELAEALADLLLLLRVEMELFE